MGLGVLNLRYATLAVICYGAPLDAQGFGEPCWQYRLFEESAVKDALRCASARPMCGERSSVDENSFQVRHYGAPMIRSLPHACDVDWYIRFGYSRDCPALFTLADRIVAVGLSKVSECGNGQCPPAGYEDLWKQSFPEDENLGLASDPYAVLDHCSPNKLRNSMARNSAASGSGTTAIGEVGAGTDSNTQRLGAFGEQPSRAGDNGPITEQVSIGQNEKPRAVPENRPPEIAGDGILDELRSHGQIFQDLADLRQWIAQGRATLEYELDDTLSLAMLDENGDPDTWIPLTDAEADVLFPTRSRSAEIERLQRAETNERGVGEARAASDDLEDDYAIDPADTRRLKEAPIPIDAVESVDIPDSCTTNAGNCVSVYGKLGEDEFGDEVENVFSMTLEDFRALYPELLEDE